MGAQPFQSVVPEIKNSILGRGKWQGIRFHRYRLHCCSELFVDNQEAV